MESDIISSASLITYKPTSRKPFNFSLHSAVRLLLPRKVKRQFSEKRQYKEKMTVKLKDIGNKNERKTKTFTSETTQTKDFMKNN